VPLAAATGFAWMATDELILARTLNATFSRDARGHIDRPERLYTAYTVRAGGASIACAFRDHVLSDLIGFTYSGWSAEAAAQDFVGRLLEAGRRFRDRAGGEDAVVPIILDGENAWEHFEGGGRPFLRALYERLSNHPELETVTMAEACRNPATELQGIFPGSWIDANFYIWIGHVDDQRAWSQLAEARQALESATVDAESLVSAREEILIAEGSDWFWWYGDDHSSAHDLEFDDLFRRHVRNAYRLMQRAIPDELFFSNISSTALPETQTQPTAWLSPTLDGDETSYFEWLGAGSLEIRETAGAMDNSHGRQSVLTLVQFGFDRERLFVRVDAVRPMVDVLDEGLEISLTFLKPDGVRFSVARRLGRLEWAFWERQSTSAVDGASPWIERAADRAAVAAGTVLELSLPTRELRVAAGDAVAFFVAVYDSGLEAERHPQHRPIEVSVPDDLFEARNWRA